jgi:hypothetical protein
MNIYIIFRVFIARKLNVRLIENQVFNLKTSRKLSCQRTSKPSYTNTPTYPLIFSKPTLNLSLHFLAIGILVIDRVFHCLTPLRYIFYLLYFLVFPEIGLDFILNLIFVNLILIFAISVTAPKPAF